MSGTDRGFREYWRRRFERFAREADDDAGIAGWTPTGLEARLRFFERHWRAPEASRRWLDVGCGAGTYARRLARADQRVVGLDYSFAAVAAARTRGPEEIGWIVADAVALPVEPGSFGGVLCLGVSQAVGGSGELVGELVRSLEDDGVLWIDGLNGWCLPHLFERLRRWITRRPRHLRYESPWRLRRLVEGAGFDRVRLYWMPILPGGLAPLQRLLERPAVARLLHAVPLLGALLSHSMVVVGSSRRPSRRAGS